MAFAATALLIASIWLFSFQPGRIPTAHPSAGAANQHAEAEFGMIKDLPVLENYDVPTSFDALSDLPGQHAAQPHPLNQMYPNQADAPKPAASPTCANSSSRSWRQRSPRP